MVFIFIPLRQGADDLETTLKAVEAQFGPYLHQVKWLNMGRWPSQIRLRCRFADF